MEYRIKLLINKNRNKLMKMIEDKKPYEEIVKQSQILDKYIVIATLDINKIKG